MRRTATPAPDGVPVVLTADRTLMADYPTLFDGMMGTIQTSAVPAFVMRRMLAPPLRGRPDRPTPAPLGLRRLEAALRASGLGADEVAIVTPERLDAAIGPATRVVGVASGDPLGRGMSNTTMVAMTGGELYTRRWFGHLLERLRRHKDRHPRLRVLAGGPGAWQLAADPDAAAGMGIDLTLTGYAECDIAGAVSALAAGGCAGPVHRAAGPREASRIPRLLGPSAMGVIELSRGCGRGCLFCTMAAEPMIHLSPEAVLADARTNLAAGVRNLALISEDFLRYGASGTGVNPDALLDLLAALRERPGLRMLQVDHVNVSSAMQFEPAQLRRARDLLTAGQRHERVWVNVGVETASAALLRGARLLGKAVPFDPDGWAELCERAIHRLCEAGFVPMVSLVLGLPGEAPADVEATDALLAGLEHLPAMAFPIFYAPIRPGERAFGIDDMTPAHWRLFRRAYAMNFRTVPPVFWDNHRAAGAPWWRRLFIQAAGRAQKLQWQLMFLRRAGWR